MSTMKCKRGDVILVLYPESNLRRAKKRPALVVQTDNLGTGLSQVIVSMISSNIARSGHPSRVEVRINTPPGQQTGLKKDSVFVTDNLATVLDNEINRVIGTWPDMTAVDAALRHTLGL